MCDKQQSTQYMHDLLDKKGYMRAWRAQVMADILLPHLIESLDQNSACHSRDPVHRMVLMAVKEFFRNMGLTSAEKVFEIEADLEGNDEEYHRMMTSTFNVIETSQEHLRPPIVSQLIYIYGLENGLEFTKKECTRQTPNQSSQQVACSSPNEDGGCQSSTSSRN